jgi:ABC-2 type transport system ATP-binding protein
VLGHDPSREAVAIRRSTGTMPENAGFYEWMSAPAYLRWYGRLYGVVSTDVDLHGLLARVGLEVDERSPIATFSRGMKQRLAIARALLPRPRLLILDEPTNGLDPMGRREIHDLLLEFAGSGNAGVLLCTHLLDDVDRLCNRIGIIDQGRTRLEGALADLPEAQGIGRRYRLRLAEKPDSASLPNGVELLPSEGGWWRVQLQRSADDPSAVWAELWRRGWRIREIRGEASSLEGLYMNHTGQENSKAQEATI